MSKEIGDRIRDAVDAAGLAPLDEAATDRVGA